MNFIKYILLAALMAASAACSSVSNSAAAGDSVFKTSGGNVIPNNANTIAVSTIKNSTSDEALPGYLMPRIKEAVNREGRLTPVGADENPDLILDVDITGFTASDIKFNEQRIPVKKRISITLFISMTQIQTGRVIFSRLKITGYKDFSEIEIPFQTAESALQSLLTEIADRIASAVATGWYTELMNPMEKGKR